MVSECDLDCIQEVFPTTSSGDSATSWAVVAMATASLLSMICLLQMDRVVESGLLRLNSSLYMSYSWLILGAFVLSWFNIVAAVAVHLRSIAFQRKAVEQLVREAEMELRRRQIEELRRFEEAPILPGLPDEETLAKSEAKLEQEKVILEAAA